MNVLKNYGLLSMVIAGLSTTGCKKDADGAIIVQRLSANFFDLTDGTASDQCSEEPDFYKVLIYKIALCSTRVFIKKGEKY